MEKRMKKFLSIFMACIIFGTSVPVQNVFAAENITESHETILGEAENISAYGNETGAVTSGDWGENATWTLDSEGTLTISGTGVLSGKATEIVPSALDIKKVIITEGITGLGSWAFSDCSNLTAITLPENLTIINDFAFWDCSALSTIEFPESLTTIQRCAFEGCKSLTNITIPGSVSIIEDSTFASCESLTNITIPGSVSKIGDLAFAGCYNLREVVLEEGVQEIGEYAFYSTSRLYDVQLPASLISIGAFAFYNSYLETIELPASLTSIGESAFSKSKLSTIEIPNGITIISTDLFLGCNVLTSVVLPESIKEIQTDAFNYCTSLKKIELYSRNCSIAANKTTIPSTISIFGYCGSSANDYAKTYGNTFVAFDDSEHIWGEYETETEPTCTGTGLSVQKCSVCGKRNEQSIPMLEHVMGEWTTETEPTCTTDGLSVQICQGCSKRNEQAIPARHTFGDWVIRKESSCFETGLQVKNCLDCTETLEEEIPMLPHSWKEDYTIDRKPTSEMEGQKSIHCSVCDEINEDTILKIEKLIAEGTCGENLTWTLDGNGTLTISGNGAMDIYNVPDDGGNGDERPWAEVKDYIKHLVIEEGVTAISDYAFIKCPNLKEIHVAEDNAFYYSEDGVLFERLPNGTSRLFCYPAAKETEIYTVPNNVTEIDHYAFSHNTGIKELIIPEGVKNIYSGAFGEYTEIERLILSASAVADENFVNSILLGTGLDRLQEVNISEDSQYFSTYDGMVYSKDGKTFLFCPKKKEGVVRIKEGTNLIEQAAFSECTEITSVILPDSVATIAPLAFMYCTNLADITLGKKVTSIEMNSFMTSPLMNIYVSKDNPSYTDIDGVLFNKKKTKLVSFPSGREGVYEIPAGVTTIGEYAFGSCKNLTSITFAGVVENIESFAFSDCEKLEKINLPEGLVSLAWFAFSRCTSLRSVSIPKSLTQVGAGIFYGKSDKLVVTGYTNSYGEGIANEYRIPFKSIGVVEPIEIYKGKSGSVSWVLDATGTLTVSGTGSVPQIFTDFEVQYDTFPSMIYTIIVEDGISSISAKAFGGFDNLHELYIPESVTQIGANAFGWRYDLGTDTTVACEDFTAYVYEASDAHIYVVQNDIPYILINPDNCLEHNYKIVTQKQATCTNTGLVQYTCKFCSYSYTREIDMLSHDYSHWQTVAPTCNQNGYEYSTCSVCGNMGKQNEKPMIGHKFSAWMTVAATTTQNGYDYRKCATCGKTEKTNETPKLTNTTSVKKGSTHTVGTNKYKVTGTSTVAFIGLKSNSTKKVSIPDKVKIKGKYFTVTAIAKNALKKKTNITSVTIGKNVKSIEASAFQSCKKLATITIKSTILKSVDKNIFKGIKSTAKIKVPSKKLSSYRKLLKNKGQGKKVKIVKM